MKRLKYALVLFYFILQRLLQVQRLFMVSNAKKINNRKNRLFVVHRKSVKNPSKKTWDAHFKNNSTDIR